MCVQCAGERIKKQLFCAVTFSYSDISNQPQAHTRTFEWGQQMRIPRVAETFHCETRKRRLDGKPADLYKEVMLTLFSNKVRKHTHTKSRPLIHWCRFKLFLAFFHEFHSHDPTKMKVILKISLRKEGRERASEFRSQIKPHSLSSTVPLAQALHNFHCIDLLLQRCGRVAKEKWNIWLLANRQKKRDCK